MKILLIDDDRSKGQRLLPVLISKCGLTLDSFSFASDASQARNHLASVVYDLVLLDLLLPADAIDSPSIQASMELLSEIIEESDVCGLKRPSAVVGVTRDKSAMSDANPLFHSMSWNIIEVDDTSDVWIEKIVRIVKYQQKVESQEPNTEKYGCDLAVITALATPELEAIHNLPWGWEVEEPLDRSTIIRRGSFSTDKRTYTVVSASASRMGMVSTAVVASKIVSSLRPRFLVMTGICAGIEQRTNLGDVIFADPCWDYQSGKHSFDKTRGSHFKISPHQIGMSEPIRARADSLRRQSAIWRDIEDGWPAKKNTKLSMHLGPLASGSAVVADESVLPAILEQRRDLLGLEMEAYGLVAAAQSGASKPTSFVIKSVCDFASSLKNDHFQEYAAYTSARAMRAFFELYMDEIYGLAGE